MFKTTLRFFIFVSLFISTIQANENKMFQTVNVKEATLVKSGSGKNFCNVCGMHLSKFYKTNHTTEFKNGYKEQYCSIRCQSLIHKDHNEKIKKIKVVDTNSLKFIDTQKAFYVIGSSKKGTMSSISKYAFNTEGEAKDFQNKFGGKIHNFEETIEIAKKHLKKDKSHLNKKRTKMAKKGKKIYATLCKKNNSLEFNSVGEAKQFLVNSDTCKKMKPKMLQAVAIYLTYPILAADQTKMMKIPEDAKCPVCGMFVSKYPKWAAKIETKDSHIHYFDGVRDMMKFYFTPSKFKHNHDINDIKKLIVTDYYSLSKTNAKNAFYVIGSNIYGPMGEELIPFKTKKEAESFSKSHYGKKILAFDEIKKEILY